MIFSFLNKRILFLLGFSIWGAFLTSDSFITKRLTLENQQFLISDPNFLVYAIRISFFLFSFCFCYFRGLFFGLPWFRTFFFKLEWDQLTFMLIFSRFLFCWSFLFSFEDLNKILLFTNITTETFRNTWEFSFFFTYARGNRKDVFLSVFLIYFVLFVYGFVYNLKPSSLYVYIRISMRMFIICFTFYYFLGEFIFYDAFLFRGSYFFLELLLFSVNFIRRLTKFK